MIKLTRPARPPFLTDERVIELTQDFKSTGRSVWNNDQIKQPLLASSNGKCAYCECPLTSDSNYMEVEHYADKRSNPDKVVVWDNLLPACKKCNAAKSTHDTAREPIVNPYVDEPKDHLAWHLYRLRGKTPIGAATIEVAALNNHSRLVLGRFLVGEKISQLLEVASDRMESWLTNRSTRNLNRLVATLEGLLTECAPQSAYAASAATALLTDNHFSVLVGKMKAENIWSVELDTMLLAASAISLDVV